MVMARLHTICGNCGCNDDFEYQVVKNTDVEEGVDFPAFYVWLWCRNCSTLHSLVDNARPINGTGIAS